MIGPSQMPTPYRKAVPASRSAEPTPVVPGLRRRAARGESSGRPPGSLRFPRAPLDSDIECSTNAETQVFS